MTAPNLPGIPVKSEDGTRTYYVFTRDGRDRCTCPAGSWGKACKHIEVLRTSRVTPPSPPAYDNDTYRARPSGSTLDQRYEDWRQSPNGIAVIAEISDRALRLRHAGVRRFGIQAIAEAVRFDAALRLGNDAEGFAVNNSFLSRLARDLMAETPDLDRFFETRQLKS